MRWSAGDALLDAHFATPFTVPAPNHPEAVDGEVPVERGDRLPLVPQHALELSVDVDLAEALPPYGVADARVDFRLGHRTALGLEMRDLIDTEYAT